LHEIQQFVFAVLMATATNNKKLMLTQIDAFENLFKKLSYQFADSEQEFKSGYEKFYKADEENWMIAKMEEITGMLKEQPFFNRFTKEQLSKLILKAKYRRLPITWYLLLPKNEIAILIDGKASIYSYSKSLNSPQIIAECGPGSILGHRSDSGVSRHLENWIHAATNIEYFQFEISDFEVFFLINKLK